MQVSRSLRCFRGRHSLRALQFFWCCEDVVGNSCQHGRLRPCASFLNYCRQQSSSSSGHDSRTSPGSSVHEAETLKEKSAKIFQTNATSFEDDNFDISELEAEIGQSKKTNTRFWLSECCSEFENAKDDSKRKEIMNSIQSQLSNAVDVALKDASPLEMRVQCLRLLLWQDEDGALIKKILDDSVNNAQFFPIKVVTDIVHLLSLSSSTELRSKVRKDLILNTVNKRWFEIGPKQIVFFLYQLDELFKMKDVCFKNRQSALKRNRNAKTPAAPKRDSTLVDNVNLEKRLISLVDELKPRDLARVVSVMAKWRNRNQILLLAVVHRLSLADMKDFSLIQLSNFLFSCSILSLLNASLLEKTVRELSSKDFSSPVLASSILSSLSRLRWYDSDLVSKYLDYLAGHVNELSSQELMNILMSLANVYAVPKTDQEISVINALGQRAISEARSPMNRVDVAWCLSILKLLDANTASTVLEPNFIQQFLETDDNNFQNINALQKLRSVNLTARFEVDGYSGPFMEDNICDADARQTKSVVHEKLASSLHNALSKFVDMNTYVTVSQSLPGGLSADAVMCAGSDGTPKPLTDLDMESTDKDLHRIAIQVIPFNSVLTSHHQMPCGVHLMASRHLHHLGYTAVQIPYSGLRESQSVLEHVNTIQSYIQKAVVHRRGSVESTTTSPPPPPPPPSTV